MKRLLIAALLTASLASQDYLGVEGLSWSYGQRVDQVDVKFGVRNDGSTSARELRVRIIGLDGEQKVIFEETVTLSGAVDAHRVKQFRLTRFHPDAAKAMHLRISVVGANAMGI